MASWRQGYRHMYEDFRARERDGWDAKAANYYDHTARVTTQAIPALLGAVRTRVGLKLLDICTGPGFAAGAAAALGAEAEGVDFAPGMVRIAARNFPMCRFSEGDAQALDFADASFDAAVCPFGVFHFDEPALAFSEAARVLRPGGRYAFSQWCAPAENPFFATVLGVFGKFADMAQVPPAPDAFALSDRELAVQALANAGFADIEVTEVPNVYHAPPGHFLDNFLQLSVRVAMILSLQTPETVAKIRSALDEAVADYAGGESYVIPSPSIVVSGRLPG